jgi:hypothetical protein
MGVGELHGASSADNTNDLETEWVTDKTGNHNCKKYSARSPILRPIECAGNGHTI